MAVAILGPIRAAVVVGRADSCQGLVCPSHRAHLIPSPLVLEEPVALVMRTELTGQILLFLLMAHLPLAAAEGRGVMAAVHIMAYPVDLAVAEQRQVVLRAAAALQHLGKATSVERRMLPTIRRVAAALAQRVGRQLQVRAAMVVLDHNGPPVLERIMRAAAAVERTRGRAALVARAAAEQVEILGAVQAVREQETRAVAAAARAVKAAALQAALAVPA